MTLSPQLVAAAIQDDPDLAKAVRDLVVSHPDTAPVMSRLLTYFQSRQTVSGQQDTKRPKQNQGIAHFFNKPNEASTASSPSTTVAVTKTLTDIGPAIYTTSALSFLHPVRKKLVLSLHKNDIALLSSTNASEIVCSAPYEALYRVLAVPFLERTTKQTALILFFRHSGISTSSKDAIWAVPLADDGKDFALQFHEQHEQLAGLSEDLRSGTAATKTPIPFVSPAIAATSNKRPDHLLVSILSFFLQKSNPAQYSSAVEMIPNPTPAYPNFSAHLKSNQGTIYLLPTGILFAFRKPILFLRAAAIEAVGVHSVLSRTFDFEVIMKDTSVATPEDLEGVPVDNKDGRRAVGFGMVDTKEFGQMEEWIKKAGIRDRSMSEDLKAKDKAVASKKRERTVDGEGDVDTDGGDSQVSSASQQNGSSAKKQRETYDDDDDDEEDQDFAPESDEDNIMEEYDSEAEGSDSDEGEKESDSRRTQRKAKKEDDEEDLEEESLGEDSEDDEEEDEEEGGGQDNDDDNDDDEVDELMDD
ncbi:histone chaperone Rttp106-like-domain-containing protein [Gamsiella multidivaricata]|uniref:histone chaperone Rttp106-like-domain-containing protein n=1 Tax=Gamsiella multidivaricata TaxID=101098 RepID=UPI002220B52F|nr:histone chaperone Rttp106-like-domain-containing protein [Gamsiella multidivaricata]KAG0369718.1 hypothetical protein BGZ54_009065 [Gamsiella multidivaricata]KAI7829354.1 histone chaperone Rttp106-like-domain-containing protein [Gamsiella multidivaricata]